MRRVLLFDTIIDGHHADYLGHLIDYWLRKKLEGELIVVAQASFAPRFDQLCESAPSVTNLRFVSILPAEIDYVHQGSIFTRPFREWNLQIQYSQRYGSTHVLLMYFDIFQMGIWLGKKASCAVSGIYFRPDFHYTGSAGLMSRLKVLRKKTTLRGVMAQSELKNLFCLDHSAVASVHAMNPRVQVLPLPDPVKAYSVTPADTETLRHELRVEPGRRIFLLFGYLDDRKGIEAFLKALNLVGPAQQRQICFLLVGPIKADYQSLIDQTIAAVSTNVQIISVFNEIKGKAIQIYFELSDYVLTLYQRHVGMASVIIRAAISQKPLLSSDYGYMGHLVQTRQLGAVTDSTSPPAIGQLLEQVLADGLSYSKVNLQQLASQNSGESFAKTIFEHL